MFIDYITLMLLNMAAGLLILALYVLIGLPRPDQRFWAAGLGIAGVVALATGLHMTLTWPIPKLEQANLTWANIAYGETTTMLGALFLGAALCIGLRRRLEAVAIYGVVASAVAFIIGAAALQLGLSNAPAMTATGYFVTGAAGMLILPTVLLRRSVAMRIVTAAVLLAAAGLWGFVGLGGYWMHLQKFSQ